MANPRSVLSITAFARRLHSLNDDLGSRVSEYQASLEPTTPGSKAARNAPPARIATATAKARPGARRPSASGPAVAANPSKRDPMTRLALPPEAQTPAPFARTQLRAKTR